MQKKEDEKKKYPWTARRIAALVGIVLLLLMYASTLVFALMHHPAAKDLLMGAVFCTIAVPVILYAMTLVARRVRGKGVPPQKKETEETED